MGLRIVTGTVAARGALTGSASAVTPVTPTLSHRGSGSVKVPQVDDAEGCA